MQTCEVTELDRIPSDEVSFHPHSFADSRIRLFSWKGQLYRAIGGDYAPFFSRLFERKVVQSLVDKSLLIDSQLTPFALEGYEIVVRHRRILFNSYPNEWCAAMLKDAALTILDLALELGRNGLTLADAHPWNLLYDIENGKLVFVDLGSITWITDFTWPVYYEFCRFCLYPLLLMSHGQEQIARLLMCEKSGVREADLVKLTSFSSLSLSSRCGSLLCRLESSFARRVPSSYRQWLKLKFSSIQAPVLEPASAVNSRSPSRSLRQRFHQAFLERIRRDVERIDLSSFYAGSQARSENGEVSISPQATWTAQQRAVHNLLTELQPQTVLDVGSDLQWYSKLASLLGSRVVCWDTDPARVTQLYYDSRASKSPILPLIMDFAQPTPSRGLANCWSISAAERFRCDMVLALGALHRMIRQGRLNFEHVVDGLALLSKRWVITEFIPGEDQELQSLRSLKYSWYTLNNFLDAARKRFGRVDILPYSDKSRPLVICENPR
jgi:hypothetical protein